MYDHNCRAAARTDAVIVQRSVYGNNLHGIRLNTSQGDGIGT